jgi:hypothetical protein
MDNPWRVALTALLLVWLVIGAIFFTSSAVKWKHNSDGRGYIAESCGGYLFAPSGIKAADGTPLRRVDLIDHLIQQNLEHQR